MTLDPLTDEERMVLQFAELAWQFPGARASEIRRQFGWSTVRFSQQLLSLAQRAEAQAFAPVTCAAVRRRIAAGHARRAPIT